MYAALKLKIAAARRALECRLDKLSCKQSPLKFAPRLLLYRNMGLQLTDHLTKKRGALRPPPKLSVA